MVHIEDAGSALSVRDSLRGLPRGWALDYTGGTKVMAAQARLCFVMWGAGTDDAAFYVDDSAGLVRFDDGAVYEAEIDAKLGAIASLHGRTLSTRQPVPRRPRPSELRHVARSVARLVDRCPSSAKALDRALGPRRDAPEWSPWRVGGRWLEMAVADAVEPLVDETIWSADLALGEGSRHAELDVVVRRHQRVGVISCTVSYGPSTVTEAKKRLFEVTERARQIGGPRARAALATLMPIQQVGLLSADIEAEWGQPGGAVVWGRGELLDLFEGDVGTFEEWMG